MMQIRSKKLTHEVATVLIDLTRSFLCARLLRTKEQASWHKLRATPETVSETMTKRGCRFTLDPRVTGELGDIPFRFCAALCGGHSACSTGLKVWLTNVQWKVETHLNVQCSLFQTSVN